MQCLYVAGYMTKCPLARDVRLREVSVSGNSTVFAINRTFSEMQVMSLRLIW